VEESPLFRLPTLNGESFHLKNPVQKQSGQAIKKRKGSGVDWEGSQGKVSDRDPVRKSNRGEVAEKGGKGGKKALKARRRRCTIQKKKSYLPHLRIYFAYRGRRGGKGQLRKGKIFEGKLKEEKMILAQTGGGVEKHPTI